METTTITLRIRKDLAEKMRKEAYKRFGKRKGAIRKYVESLLDDKDEIMALIEKGKGRIGKVSREEMHERD